MRQAPLFRMLLIAGLGVAALGIGWSLAQQEGTPPPAPPPPPQEAEPAAPPDTGVPALEASRKNPIEADDDSISKGKTLYGERCADCHGKTGNGRGDLALRLHYKVPDFTKGTALKSRSDGELFYFITKGCGGMPGEQEYISDTDKWNLVNFCRTLGPKE